MRFKEVIDGVIGKMTLKESDEFIFEMANFLADVTELPANIVLWTETNPEKLPHDKYRMKVYKDRVHCSTYSIGQHPVLRWETPRKKLKLDGYETEEVKRIISEFSSLFIQYVDGKMTAKMVKEEIKRLKNT